MMAQPTYEAWEVAQDLNAMRHAKSEDALLGIARAMKGLGRWDSTALSVFTVRMNELTDGA